MEEIAPNILDEGQSLEKALSDSPIDTYTKYTYKELFERNPECAACEYRYKCSGCRANALACGGFFEKDPLACCFFKGGYEDMIKKIMA
jgi:radical SAM protein with 4Fe4S-binding SPASM domain